MLTAERIQSIKKITINERDGFLYSRHSLPKAYWHVLHKNSSIIYSHAHARLNRTYTIYKELHLAEIGFDHLYCSRCVSFGISIVSC